ncbi:MAG: GTP cyclohydrolase II [Micropepsaceae bacterium]
MAERLLGGAVAVDRAAAELRRGLPVIVLPAKGVPSLIVAAELASPGALAALAQWSGGQPRVLLTHHRAATLKIRLYTDEVVAVPLPGEDTARAAQVLADPTRDLRDPMMGPWQALREPIPAGAKAAIKLAKIAGLLPAAVEVPVKAAVAKKLAAREALPIVRVDEIEKFETPVAFKVAARARLPLEGAEDTRVLAFRPTNGAREHLALIVGSPEPPGPVLVRLHSECLTGDLLGSLKCDCGDQLRGAIAAIGKVGHGILLYLAQEGRGIGLINKLKAYELQDQGFDTIEANQRLGFEADEREFAAAAEMLKYLGFGSVRLLTNNPDKVAALARHGIEVVERVAHSFPTNPHNEAYLATKKAKAGHLP